MWRGARKGGWMMGILGILTDPFLSFGMLELTWRGESA